MSWWGSHEVKYFFYTIEHHEAPYSFWYVSLSLLLQPADGTGCSQPMAGASCAWHLNRLGGKDLAVTLVDPRVPLTATSQCLGASFFGWKMGGK